MTLKIGFGKPVSWFVPLAWAIEAFGDTEFSHMYFVGGDQVFQCTTAGTNSLPYSTFTESYQVIKEFSFELNDEQTQVYQAFCAQYADKAYSYKLLFGYLAADVFHLEKNPFASDSDLDCTKLSMIFMRSRPELFSGIDQTTDINLVTLKMVFDFLSK